MRKRMMISVIALGIFINSIASYSMRGKSYHRIALEKLNSKLEYLEESLKRR